MHKEGLLSGLDLNHIPLGMLLHCLFRPMSGDAPQAGVLEVQQPALVSILSWEQKFQLQISDGSDWLLKSLESWQSK